MLSTSSEKISSLCLCNFHVVQGRTSSSHAEWYRQMARGTAPRPVKIGSASRWPVHEIDELIAARIAGKSDDEIKELVSAMHAGRVAASRGGA